MPFDPNRAKPAKAPGFNAANAKPAVAPGFVPREEREARIAANETERAGYAERAASSPLENYGRDWRDAIGRGREALSQGPTWKTYPEAALTAATGITSSLTAPIETLIRDLVPGGPTADLEEIRGRHIYQPTDPAAQGLVDTVGGVFKPLGDALSIPGEFAGDVADFAGADPETAKRWRDSTNIAGEVLTGGKVAGMPKAGPKRINPDVPAAERAAFEGRQQGKVTETLPSGGRGNIGAARAEGFKVTPDVASMQPERQGMPNTGLTRQKLAGPGVKPRFQMENQQVANARVAEELGLDGAKPLSGQLKVVFDAHNKVANEIAETLVSYYPDGKFRSDVDAIGARLRDNPALESSPRIEALRARLGQIEKMSGQQMLDTIREFRQEAKVSLQSLDDFDKHQTGRAYRAAADAVEAALERGAAPFARPGLMDDFKRTRVQSAKAHDVQSALIGDNVNMGVLKNIGAENLTGGLQRLARIAEEFPELTRTQSAIRSGENPLSLAFSPGKLTAQRMWGRGMTDKLLSDEFQNRYGGQRVDTGLSPPKGPAASRVQEVQGPGSGGVDFEPRGGVLPPRAFVEDSGLELVPDPVPGAEQLPADGPRFGDLTASEPPAQYGDVNFEPTDLGPGPVISRWQEHADGGETTYMPTEAGLALGDEMGSFPGAKVPEEAAVTEWATDQPVERRRGGAQAQPYTGIERRFQDGTPDLTAERQRVLDRPLGTPPNVGLADELLADPAIQAGTRADTTAGRVALNPDEMTTTPPVIKPLTDKEMLELQVEPAALEFEAQNQPRPAGLGDEMIDPDLPEGAGYDRGPPTPGPVVSEFGDFERTGRAEPPMSGTASVRQNAEIDPTDNRFARTESENLQDELPLGDSFTARLMAAADKGVRTVEDSMPPKAEADVVSYNAGRGLGKKIAEARARKQAAKAPPKSAAEAHGRMIGEERALAMQEIDSAIAENPKAYGLVGARYNEIKRMADEDAQLDALDALRQDMIDAALMRERRPDGEG